MQGQESVTRGVNVIAIADLAGSGSEAAKAALRGICEPTGQPRR